MRPPRAATRATAPAISAAGFGPLQDDDILVGGGGLFGSSLPVVRIGRNQEINGASSELRFGWENGDTADEAVVVGGRSGEDVAGIGLEDLAGGERRREFLDMAVEMNHSD